MRDHVTDDPLEDIALYALGALDAAEGARVEAHLAEGCAACERELRGFVALVAELGHASQAPRPDAGLRERVLERARDTDVRGIVVHPSDLRWERAAGAGVTVKHLFAEPAAGRQTTLVRLAPRTPWTVDDAAADHELYVLEGRVTLGDGEVRAGEYALAGRFEGMAGDEGCTVVLARSNREEPGHRAQSVVRPAEQEWRPGGTPGVAVKRLVGDPARRGVTALVRMDAGARLRSHRHVTPERFYMLAGDLHVSGHDLGPGAFCAAAAGTVHDGTFSRSGCEFLLISTEVELL